MGLPFFCLKNLKQKTANQWGKRLCAGPENQDSEETMRLICEHYPLCGSAWSAIWGWKYIRNYIQTCKHISSKTYSKHQLYSKTCLYFWIHFLYIFLYLWIYVWRYIYIYIYIFEFLYFWIYIYIYYVWTYFLKYISDNQDSEETMRSMCEHSPLCGSTWSAIWGRASKTEFSYMTKANNAFFIFEKQHQGNNAFCHIWKLHFSCESHFKSLE